VLGIPPRSTGAYAVKVGVAFFLSGALHAATLPFGVPGLSPLRYAAFFFIQGVCVLVEVLVEQMFGGRMLKPKGRYMRVVLGFVRSGWVVGVLYATAPLIADELTKVSRVMGLRSTVLFPVPK